MEKFTVHTGTAVPLRRSNVDTDQIIPAAYLKRVSRTGFADGLFEAWRDDSGFVLNDPAYAGGSILVAGPEFGIGSSREHAVWALRDWGFKAVVAPRFGDIFRGNALKEGLLPVELAPAIVERLWDLIEHDPTLRITVDLRNRRVSVEPPLPAGVPGEEASWEFVLDEFSRWRLLEGLDDIGLTLRNEAAITAYEQQRPTFLPVVT